MVDTEVKTETKKLLLELFDSREKLIDYAFKGGVLDVNKCRIAIIKRYYYDMISSGMTACMAKEQTAEKFFRSVRTIENLIYNDFYKGIKFE